MDPYEHVHRQRADYNRYYTTNEGSYRLRYPADRHRDHYPGHYIQNYRDRHPNYKDIHYDAYYDHNALGLERNYLPVYHGVARRHFKNY